MAVIMQTTFQIHVFEWKLLDLDENLIEFVPYGSIKNIPALV